MRLVTILFSGILFLSACTSTSAPSIENTSLNATEFSQLITQTEDPIIIDVRTSNEFAEGHLKNAVNIDWNSDSFLQEINNLDKKSPIFVYCLSGNRSSFAAAAMREKGFEKVVELEGGILAWRANQLEEEGSNATKNSALSMDDFNKQINEQALVLVDFYADWCSPCKKMEPYLLEIEEDSKATMKLLRINTDEYPELAAQLKITGLPTLKLYKNGKEVWNQLGLVDEATIREQLKKNQ